ncbi:MAG: 3-methyl-2-oxobutanoate hydroxymethyltransferase [Candidatus Omnitrophota bacterium]
MTVKDILLLKGKRKITMLTAYDYPFASLVDKAGIDIILIGDSLANVVLGLESTKEVGMTEMLYHSKAVCRAVKQALVIGDMPYESYQAHPDEAVKNARRFIDIGCAAIKLEWFEKCLEVTGEIIKAGIPVMGHIGLTPQTADKLGGFKVQGKDAEAAKRLIEQAQQLEKAGCFAIVLECVPDRIAAMVSVKLKIPTIGIGAGADCDGQVLVMHDMLGLFDRYRPKFVKQFINLGPMVQKAMEEYKEEVISGKFPAKEHCFTISKEELEKL